MTTAALTAVNGERRPSAVALGPAPLGWRAVRRAAARGLPAGLEGAVWQALLGPAAAADTRQYAEAVKQAEHFCEQLEFDWRGGMATQKWPS